MKVWQKIYLVVLVISILFVTLGMYGVFHLTYQENLKSEQNRGETSYHLMESSIQNTMYVLENEGRLSEDVLKDLMRVYENEYKNQQIQITIYKNGQQIYSGEKNLKIYLNNSSEIKTKIFGEQWNKYFLATSQLSVQTVMKIYDMITFL